MFPFKASFVNYNSCHFRSFDEFISIFIHNYKLSEKIQNVTHQFLIGGRPEVFLMRQEIEQSVALFRRLTEAQAHIHGELLPDDLILPAVLFSYFREILIGVDNHIWAKR